MIQPRRFRFNNTIYTWDTPHIMGIINVTPDSFYSASSYQTSTDILNAVGFMVKQGAQFIDIGAMSSRPGAQVVSPQEEISRLKEILPLLKKEFENTIFSLDTLHSDTAWMALDHGFDIINDISGGTYDNMMYERIASYSATLVIMHMLDLPSHMQDNPLYSDVATEVYQYLHKTHSKAKAKGIHQIILDPGFGFGKTITDNYTLLNALPLFTTLEAPLLCGLSRKSMIYKPLNITPEKALNGTSALHMAALMRGAHILRAHDIVEAREVITLYNLLKG